MCIFEISVSVISVWEVSVCRITKCENSVCGTSEFSFGESFFRGFSRAKLVYVQDLWCGISV